MSISSKGLIIFIDGIPATGKTSLAKELSKVKPNYILLSSDDLYDKMSTTNKDYTYLQSALDIIDEAIKFANEGHGVIIDSWITDKALNLREYTSFNVLLIGLWCPLPCLIHRYDDRAGVLGSWINSSIFKDYMERYKDLTIQELIQGKGEWNKKVSYDIYMCGCMLDSKDMVRLIYKRLNQSSSYYNTKTPHIS